MWMRTLTAALGVAILHAAVSAAAPVKAEFARDVSTTQWPLAELDAALPADWSDAQFLVVEYRSSTSQRFELALVTDAGTWSKRVYPYANVWVRAAIPLRHFRESPAEASERAASFHQPGGSQWMDTEGGGHGALDRVRALAATMRYPAHAASLEIRKVSLARTDPGDAVLDGGAPLVDDFGQYTHADWPEKIRARDPLVREWRQEERMLVPKAVVRPSRYGGLAGPRRKATGFFRVEKVDGRWWFIDPDGCRFWAAGVSGAGLAPPLTRILGRDKSFASIPTAAQFAPASAPPGTRPDPLRDPVSFFVANELARFGAEWQVPAAQLATRRMRAWGLNTAVGPALNASLGGAPTKQPYVHPLPGWQRAPGAILGLPDVYAPEFARSVDADALRQLAPLRDDPWMIGYFIGSEPAWSGRESELVERVLSGPDGPLKARFKAGLARGDTAAARKQLVYAAFRQYLDIVNAAVRRADPNHLNLGLRFADVPAADLVAVARGFDVFSLSAYRWAPPRELIERIEAAQRVPVFIDAYHFGVAERGHSPGRVPVLSQTERGVAYSYFVEHAAAHPAIVGTLWSDWVDQPVTGRLDGENSGVGWIDVTDRPYPELVAAAKATHAKLEDIRLGKIAATSRHPRASEFGTPDDAVDFGVRTEP